MIIIKSEIGEKLRELRKQKEKTLNMVSDASGVDLTLLSKIERGERLPTQEQLLNLASYYNYSASELKTLLVAEKIIKDYGISEETLRAINLVREQILKYLKK